MHSSTPISASASAPTPAAATTPTSATAPTPTLAPASSSSAGNQSTPASLERNNTPSSVGTPSGEVGTPNIPNLYPAQPQDNSVCVLTFHLHQPNAIFERKAVEKYKTNPQKGLYSTNFPTPNNSGSNGTTLAVIRHIATCCHQILEEKNIRSSFMLADGNLGFTGQSIDSVAKIKKAIVELGSTEDEDVRDLIANELLTNPLFKDKYTEVSKNDILEKLANLHARFIFVKHDEDENVLRNNLDAIPIEIFVIGSGGEAPLAATIAAYPNEEIIAKPTSDGSSPTVTASGPTFQTELCKKHGCFNVTTAISKLKLGERSPALSPTFSPGPTTPSSLKRSLMIQASTLTGNISTTGMIHSVLTTNPPGLSWANAAPTQDSQSSAASNSGSSTELREISTSRVETTSLSAPPVTEAPAVELSASLIASPSLLDDSLSSSPQRSDSGGHLTDDESFARMRNIIDKYKSKPR